MTDDEATLIPRELRHVARYTQGSCACPEIKKYSHYIFNESAIVVSKTTSRLSMLLDMQLAYSKMSTIWRRAETTPTTLLWKSKMSPPL